MGWRRAFHTAFWESLEAGLTVSEARNSGVWAMAGLPDVGDSPNPAAFMAVYGDYYARLYGLYTGTISAPNDWFNVENGGQS